MNLWYQERVLSGGSCRSAIRLCKLGRGILLAVLAVTASTASAATCPGDCDGSGDVTVNELVLSVSIALGTLPVGECRACDTDGSGDITIDEVIVAVNAALVGCPATPTVPPSASPTTTPAPAVTPIFPANYRNTYIEVRNCRFSIEHDGVAIRVLTNPLAVQPYLENHNPLPVGSIVVKEEYNDSDCSDDSKLVRWRAMRKEEPGFDAFGDWHWQWVNRNRTVRYDDKTTCIGCHLAPACVERDYMCTLPSKPAPPPLRVVFDGLPPALLAAAGTSSNNVFIVGADPGDGLGPYVLHYNGQCWKRLKTGVLGALWWISFKPIGNAFYMVGESGLILRYDLATGQFERQITPGNQQLFGVWGETPDSVWAVGGDLANESTGGLIWHYDGDTWRSVDLTGILPGGSPILFKIWGRSENDIYAVGQGGTILHYDGQNWARLASPTNRALFTVHGNDELVVATGGFNSGVIVENAGAGFVDRTPAGVEQVNGVYVPEIGNAVGVGVHGSMALRDANGWSAAETDLDRRRDFHAVWIDPQGGVWAVGGDLSVDLGHGMLVYGGTGSIPTEIDGGRCGETAPVMGAHSHDIPLP